MLNKVMIIGRLGRDPELRYSQSGSPVCTLNIATDESYTDRDGNRVDRARVAPRRGVPESGGELLPVPDQGQPRVCGRQPANPQMAGSAGAGPLHHRNQGPARPVPRQARRRTGRYAQRRGRQPKAATALPAVLRRLSREAAAVPSSARSSGRTITKIWARRFLPRPAAWTTCRSREIWGRERGTFLQKGSPFLSQAPPFPLPRRLTDEEAARKEFVPRYGWGDGISVFDSKVTFPHHTACPLMATPPKHAPSDHRGAPWKEASSVFHP